MTKEDFILEAALRLIPVYPYVNRIPEIAKKLASDLFEDDSNHEYTKFDNKLYKALIEELHDYFEMFDHIAIMIADAFMKHGTTITLEAAGALAKAYASINTLILKEALEKGEIEGVVPPKEEIAIREDNGKTYTKQQGRRYYININSLVLWLDKNYTCKISPETILYKMILKIKQNTLNNGK
jgi:hypothetical protein